MLKYLIFLISIFSFLQGIEILTEVKAGYFHPSNKKFRRIYGGSGIYGIEFSYQMYKKLYAWNSANYFKKSGHSLGSKNRTSLYFVPVGVGIKYLFHLNRQDFYLGAGALTTYLNIKNHSPYVIPTEAKWGFGGVFKGGLLFYPHGCLLIDLFADYSLMKVYFHDIHHHKIIRHDANLNGFSIGGAIGFRF